MKNQGVKYLGNFKIHCKTDRMEKIVSNSYRSIKLREKTQFQIEMERFFKEQGIELKSQSEYYIENPPYSNFVIEKLDSKTLSFTHYSNLNSDFVSDPEISFKINQGIWVPFELIIGNCRYNFSIPKNQFEILNFIDIWIKNLIDQKFLEKKLAEYLEN